MNRNEQFEVLENLFTWDIEEVGHFTIAFFAHYQLLNDMVEKCAERFKQINTPRVDYLLYKEHIYAIYSELCVTIETLMKLLLEENAKYYNEKEYTIEYISSLVGVKNVGEMKEYVEGKKEPDEDIKQRFVDVFGVNRDWMLYNQGDYPFASNLEKFMNGAKIFDNKPMDILRNEKLFAIKEFIIVFPNVSLCNIVMRRKFKDVESPGCFRLHYSIISS